MCGILCTLLLMVSNVLVHGARVFRAGSHDVNKSSLVQLDSHDKVSGKWKKSAEEFNTEDVKSLLALQFAEPLPQLLSRAQKTATTLSLEEALNVGRRAVSAEVRRILKANRSTFMIQTDSSPMLTSHALVDQSRRAPANGLGSVFEEAMAFINKQFIQVRKEIDIKLFECGFYKLVNENLLTEVAERLDEIGQDIGLAEAVVERASGEILEITRIIAQKKQELKQHEDSCRETRMALEAELRIIMEDLRVIKLIKGAAVVQCKKDQGGFLIQACVSAGGKTVFQTSSAEIMKQASMFKSESAAKDFQGLLFHAFGGLNTALPAPLDLAAIIDTDGSAAEDDFPEGSPAFTGSLIETDHELSKLHHIHSHNNKETYKRVNIDKDVGVIALNMTHGHNRHDIDKDFGARSPTRSSDSPQSMMKKCPIGEKPNCGELMDKLATMQGDKEGERDEKQSELDAHNTECKRITDDLNNEIEVALSQATVSQTEWAKANGEISSLQIEQGEEQNTKRQLCHDLREKYKECYKELTQLEAEICSVINIRQKVYNTVKNPDGKGEQMLIKDCEMSDWTIGPCSSSCTSSEGPGIQLITRHIDNEWEPWKKGEKDTGTRYGAGCLPDTERHECSTQPCPIDCKLGEWSGWAECSKECGGGTQGRVRQKLVAPQHGGMECEPTTDRQNCNTQACDADCELSLEWTTWSACSMPCKWRRQALPGTQERKKHVVKASIGNGMCPEPHSKLRLETRSCNDVPCPREIECAADLDIVLVLDGSGSLWHRPPKMDANFEMVKKWSYKLVQHSQLAKVEDKGDEKVIGPGMRFGVVLYSMNAVQISPITADKEYLKKQIDGMKWPRGWTATGLALYKARDMLRVGGTRDRRQVVLLVTDGMATNVHRTRRAAREIKEQGVRIIMIPIHRTFPRTLEDEMCGWATEPCSQNMLKTEKWPYLLTKMNWYITRFCPMIEPFGNEEIGV